jgi:hypothetical protein
MTYHTLFDVVLCGLLERYVPVEVNVETLEEDELEERMALVRWCFPLNKK